MLENETKESNQPFSGMKILVVDDEADIQEFISTVLTDYGAETAVASDGDEAISKAKSMSPDLITLDLSMPGKNGVDAFIAFRQDSELQSIPICIITGKPEMRKLIYERPALPVPEGYLDKPISEKVLVKNIRKIFKLSGRNN